MGNRFNSAAGIACQQHMVPSLQASSNKPPGHKTVKAVPLSFEAKNIEIMK